MAACASSPGSHRHGIVTHATSDRAGNQLSINQEIPDGLVDSSSAVDVVLRAGQIAPVTIHDGHLMFHASQPNRSHRRRCGMTVRFIRPDVRQATDNSLGSDWRPVLLAGDDRHGNFTLAERPFPD